VLLLGPDVVRGPLGVARLGALDLGEQGPALIGYSGYWREDNDNPPLKRFLAFIRNRFALSFDPTASFTEKDSSLSGDQPS